MKTTRQALEKRLEDLEEETELDRQFEALLCRLETLPDSIAERRNRANAEIAAVLRRGVQR
jgi:hypothetical protein